VTDLNDDSVFRLRDLRRFELQATHGVERRSKPLANVLVGGIRELVNPSNDQTIPRGALVKNVLRSDVRCQRTTSLPRGELCVREGAIEGTSKLVPRSDLPATDGPRSTEDRRVDY